jgi:hypothetical protein
MEFSTFPNEYNGQDNTISSKILDIMRLALEINPPTIKDIGEKKTAVFVWWSPQCPQLNVMIHDGGWKKDVNADEDYSVYTDCDDAEEKLDNIIKRLYEIKEDNDETV